MGVWVWPGVKKEVNKARSSRSGQGTSLMDDLPEFLESLLTMDTMESSDPTYKVSHLHGTPDPIYTVHHGIV